jgi:hypothetical protein
MQPRRLSLDAAKHQVFDRIETDGAQSQGVAHGAVNYRQIKTFQQAQHLDILALAGSAHARFQ